MSNSLQPHELRPSRPLCPWDFPGKNTSEWPFAPPGDLPDPGLKTASLAFSALAGGFFFTTEPPGKPCVSSAPSSTWALSAEYRAMTALLSKASGGPYSVQVYDLRYNWENHLKSTKLKIRCGKLKGSKQRNEGYKNLRVSWAPHHQQAPEQVAPVTQGPLQRISAEAGENTLRRAGSQSVRSRRPNDSI